MRIHCFTVGIGRAMGNPGAVTRIENRLKRSHQATGRDLELDSTVSVDVMVRLTIGYNEKRTPIKAAADSRTQPFRGPKRISRIAQPGLLTCDGSHFSQTPPQMSYL